MRGQSDRIWSSIANNQLSPITNNDHLINQQSNYQSQFINQRSRSRTNYQSFPTANYDDPNRDWIRRTMVGGYTNLVIDRVRQGWSCHLMTIMFPHIAGSQSVIIGRMKDQVQRLYSAFVTRVHRSPRSAPTDSLPVLIAAADLPVRKRDRTVNQLVRANGGLHCHGILLVPPYSRLRISVQEHFDAEANLYAGAGRLVERVHVKPVETDHSVVVDYVLKSIVNGRLAYDDAILVLPRSGAELAN